jgi:hypothetical protein
VTDATLVRDPAQPTERSIDAERFLDTLGKTDELPATDDVLARVLPLFEQVAAVHEAGRVAPLEGVEMDAGAANGAFVQQDDPRRGGGGRHLG